MKWRITSFTELQHLPPADRERLVRRCFGAGHMLQMAISSFIVGGIAGLCAGGLFVEILGMREPWALVPIAAAVLAGTIVVYQVRLIRIRGQLLMYLERIERHRRLPMCLYCGYSLEGLTGGVCPECGRPFEARPDA